ncbi:MAG TPA: 4'-phosphopantetheinyl transferase superfamily protein [Bacteroidales bacterium]|nr:4'-phosphopantetheinyl transferase superfamily protein [Bacteroidales bacterium]
MISNYSTVRCFFQPSGNVSSAQNCNINLFYAESKNLDYDLLKRYISEDEAKRASLFHSADDRRTYTCCHAILRLVLSGKLLTAASEITISKEKNNKPYVAGSPFHFNISHTRSAFAIAVSDQYTGIDLENIDRRLDMKSILHSTFGTHERTFITQDQSSERERFFLLWTRKEAFLKAIGVGIIHHLRKIKVAEECNVINRNAVAGELEDRICDEHFIYSMRISDNILSVATPNEADVKLDVIDESNFGYMFSDQLNFSIDSAVRGI